jgi:aminopeptidase N
MTWFPGNHHPSDKATYDITVTVPKDADGDPYDVIGNGKLIAEEDKGEAVTQHWRTDEPMASHLAHVNVGSFDTHKGHAADGVPVNVVIDSDEAEDSADVVDMVPEIVHWASKRFGPAPRLHDRCRRRPPARTRLGMSSRSVSGRRHSGVVVGSPQ